MAFDPRRIESIELSNLINNPEFVRNYEVAKKALRQSGVVNFLRMFSRPFLFDGGENVNRAAAQAAFCNGYSKCLDDLLYFDELYVTDQKLGKKDVKATFGALEIARAKGDLTDKDISKLKGTK